MEISLQCQTLNEKLPADYHRSIMSLCKHALTKARDGRYLQQFYGESGRRPFTFAVKLPNPRFFGDTVILSKNILSITISTGDLFTANILQSAFLACVNKPYPLPMDNKLTVTKVVIHDSRLVTSSTAVVKMLSPLCLREHNPETNRDIYVSVASKNFIEKSKEILTEQLLSEGFSKDVVQTVEFVPINARKTVIRHYDCQIECSLGIFSLHADKAVINYLLQYGIGSRKSSGFGFAKLIAESEEMIP